MDKIKISFEGMIERILLFFSKALLIPIVAGLVAFIIMLILGCIEIFKALQALIMSIYDSTAYSNKKVIDYAISAIDAYFIGTVFFIFSFGIYKLFLAKPSSQKYLTTVFKVENLDDLKNNLGNAIILALIISYFGVALELEYTSVLSLLYSALGVFVLAAALLLTKKFFVQSNKTKNDSE